MYNLKDKSYLHSYVGGYIYDIKAILTLTPKKVYKTNQFRHDTVVLYQFIMTTGIKTELTKIVGDFLQYLAGKKRIGITRINNYIKELEGSINV